MWDVLRKEHYDPMKFEGPECPDSYDGSSAVREQCIKELLKEIREPSSDKKTD
ncbi:hypothetical protein Emed_003514 [Eimeria media]